MFRSAVCSCSFSGECDTSEDNVLLAKDIGEKLVNNHADIDDDPDDNQNEEHKQLPWPFLMRWHIVLLST